MRFEKKLEIGQNMRFFWKKIKKISKKAHQISYIGPDVILSINTSMHNHQILKFREKISGKSRKELSKNFLAQRKHQNRTLFLLKPSPIIFQKYFQEMKTRNLINSIQNMITFGKLQMPITRMCLAQKKYLKPFNDSIH